MATMKTAKRPTRKHYLCFNADFRGYTHHCSRLMWSERRDGPSAATLCCCDPYRASPAKADFPNGCTGY